MKLVCQTKLHFQSGNSDKIYEVDLCEVGDKFVVNFRYGRRGSVLREGTKTTNPVGFQEAQKIFDQLISEKSRKGYHIVGEKTKNTEETESVTPKTVDNTVDEEERIRKILDKLSDKKAKSNPKISRVIWRVGELKIKAATPLLIDFIGTGDALRDYCIAWSLGFCGDQTTIPVLVNLLNHKADFVQRIAREAIFKLSDDEGKDRLRQESISTLSDVWRNLLTRQMPTSFDAALAEEFDHALVKELEGLKKGSFRFLAKLYEIDNEISRQLMLDLLREIVYVPGFFKPVRQIYKIAEYRRDAEVFGIIAKKFETERAGFHSNIWWEGVSIIDENGNYKYINDRKKELANENSRIAFSNKTKEYFQRRTWRTLRRLGEIGDEDYVKMAVGALLAYSDQDAKTPRKSAFYDYYHTGQRNWQNPLIREIHWDKFSPYLLFNQILYKNSPRYELKTGSRGFRLREGCKVDGETPQVREEAFPELWEKQPLGLVQLLTESECLPVHEFAVKALRDCSDFIKDLKEDVILIFLSSPYEITAGFGFELAMDRYDEENPNIELVTGGATCESKEARAKAFRLISAPKPKLKNAQTWILENILNKIKVDDAAHGFLPSKNIVTNAEVHVGAKMLINFDLENFFPSINYKRVKGIFKSFGYSEAIATVLGLICTAHEVEEIEIDSKTYFVGLAERHLPQGSPASPAISNIIARRFDKGLTKIAQNLNFNYTRYADDLSFSTKSSDTEFKKLMSQVRYIAKEQGFKINENKTRILRRGRQQEVTGIVVNDKISIDRKTLRKFRAVLHQAETRDLENLRWGNSPDLIASLQGYANFVFMVDREKGYIFRQQVKRIIEKYDWKPTPPKYISKQETAEKKEKPWWQIW
jgi:retron-type reverse transcriptase/predicted DNA-binding WGR domain protein